MEFKECIKSRRSIRKFKEEKVPFAYIQHAVEAATYSPSWKNTQVARYYAVTSETIKSKLVACLPKYNEPAAESAPVLMVVTAIKYRSGYNREGQFDTLKGAGWQMYDCGASNMIFCLEANEQGLGTVIMGCYDENAVTEILEIADTEEVIAIIAVGYPDEEPIMPKRKAIEIILKEI